MPQQLITIAKKQKDDALKIFFLLLAAILCSISYGNETGSHGLAPYTKNLQLLLRNANIPEYPFEVIHTYPHDKRHFTEGLFFQNGLMYESSGLYGKSSLSITQMESGKVKNSHPLPKTYFAEGMTIQGNELYQLTWLEHVGFVYDKETLQIKRHFFIPKQGWGLATNGRQLIMSDGSAEISMLDPISLQPLRSISVKVEDQKISSINELEVIHGMIFANVWPTSIILVIEPQDGKVIGWLNIAKLSPPLACLECVANGIAYNENENLIYLTGKNWPNLYAVRISA